MSKTFLFFVFLEQFQCCGIAEGDRKGYEIYALKNSHFSAASQTGRQFLRKVPRSCCIHPRDENSVERCVNDPQNPQYTFHDVSIEIQFIT